MSRFKITVLISMLFAALCLPSSGQGPQRNVYEFGFIKDSNPWLTSSNASGISTLQTDRSSFVEAYFDKDDGALIPVEGSDDSWEAGAKTESYVRISDRIAFHGALSYSYFMGRNMGGHYLMDPSYNPINFVETTEDNTGIKVKELYSLLGGISYFFNDRWSVGAEIGYETGDYAKRKDPRPRSRWMDLDISAGVRFAPKDNFSAGLSLIYRRTTENLETGTFGTTDKQYFTMVDYGGYLGSVESLSGSQGFIRVTEPGRPMMNAFYGGAVQLAFGRADDILFFNELEYRYRTGHYGEQASDEAIYCEFSGSAATYTGTLDIRRGDDLHKIGLNAGYEGLSNMENIYRWTTIEGGNTIVEYFGRNEIYRKIGFSGKLSYTGYLGISQFRPEWEYGAEISGDYSTFRATYYPYYRDQTIVLTDAVLYGRKNIRTGANIFTVGLAAEYRMGFGTKNSDGKYAESASDNHRTMDSYLNRDFEYDTAARCAGTLSFRYTRLFGSKISAYVDVRDTYVRTLKKPEFLAEGWRNMFTVAIGCAF